MNGCWDIQESFFWIQIPGQLECPPNVEDYEKSKGEWRQIAGVLRPGTLIKISKVELENDFEMGKEIWVYGHVVDVPWTHGTANLSFVSKNAKCSVRFVDLPMVDTNILEFVNKP